MATERLAFFQIGCAAAALGLALDFARGMNTSKAGGGFFAYRVIRLNRRDILLSGILLNLTTPSMFAWVAIFLLALRLVFA